LDIVYFTLWFMVALATLWDIRRSQRFHQQSLERIDAAARDIARFLGTDRR
jgi:hypothetical protein